MAPPAAVLPTNIARAFKWEGGATWDNTSFTNFLTGEPNFNSATACSSSSIRWRTVRCGGAQRYAGAAYGAYLVRGCTGCHGDGLSGGPIPGAPPSTPVPLNLTPHETGLAAWTYEDFDKLLTQGVRKSGKKLDPFMPVEALGKLEFEEALADPAVSRQLADQGLSGARYR